MRTRQFAHAALVAVPSEAQLAPLLSRYRAVATRRQRAAAIAGTALLLAVALACWGAEVDLAKLVAGLPNFGSYFGRLARLDTGAVVWSDPASWFWGLRRWTLLLGQTLLIAYLGTASGLALGICGGVLASTNLVRSALLRFAVRRTLEVMRTVPDIVCALVLVVAFGLGPLPGVLAITLHTGGTLGKLFAEVIENIDLRPLEAVAATGGSWLSLIRFGVLPQVLSNFASYALLRFEVNVRGAAVIGFVGAGGIGQDLLVAIRKFYYSDVSAILLMILLCVVAIDLVSERVRHRLLRMEAGRCARSAPNCSPGPAARLGRRRPGPRRYCALRRRLPPARHLVRPRLERPRPARHHPGPHAAARDRRPRRALPRSARPDAVHRPARHAAGLRLRPAARPPGRP